MDSLQTSINQHQKNRIMNNWLAFVFLISTINGLSQDSIHVLSYTSFMEQVMDHHPYVYQAEISANKGNSTITQAKGAFDPKLTGDVDQKYYDNKQYYSHLKGGLKIPTWYGISFESGYVLNNGAFLNPEKRVPESGLWYAGVRLDLGNGLIINQRKADLDKAKLYQSSTQFERTILRNELYRNASEAFWKWEQAFLELQVYESAIVNAIERLNAVKEACLFGEKPFIDTVEAAITVHTRKMELIKAKNKFNNAELKVEQYLWLEGFIPLELDNMIPVSEKSAITTVPLETLESAISSHPSLQIVDLQLKMQEIDLKLKQEQLKPQVTLKYNALSEAINNNPIGAYSIENYTWGGTFAYPILTRKERGNVQLAKLKIQDQELKFKGLTAELRYEIHAAYNDYTTAFLQLKECQQLLTNSELLFQAEKELFNLGESSVFMINSRENNWLKIQTQFIELETNCKVLYAILNFQLMTVQ
jgi:outer membrane protein TolC